MYVLVPPEKFGPLCVVQSPEYLILPSSFCTVVLVRLALNISRLSPSYTFAVTHPSAPRSRDTTARSSKSPVPWLTISTVCWFVFSPSAEKRTVRPSVALAGERV